MTVRAGIFGNAFAGDSGGAEVMGGPEMSPITDFVTAIGDTSQVM